MWLIAICSDNGMKLCADKIRQSCVFLARILWCVCVWCVCVCVCCVCVCVCVCVLSLWHDLKEASCPSQGEPGPDGVQGSIGDTVRLCGPCSHIVFNSSPSPFL